MRRPEAIAVDYFDRASLSSTYSRGRTVEPRCPGSWPASAGRRSGSSGIPRSTPAARPGFHNAGCRGCFLSHLAALNLARNAGHQAVLILEDDCAVRPGFRRRRRRPRRFVLGDLPTSATREQPRPGPAPLVEWPSAAVRCDARALLRGAGAVLPVAVCVSRSDDLCAPPARRTAAR